jgi:hypothetical protein
MLYCASPAKYFGFLSSGETSEVSLVAGYFWFSPVASVNSAYFWVVTVTSVGLGDFADWPLTHAADALVSLFTLIVPMGVLVGVYGATAELFFDWWYKTKKKVDGGKTGPDSKGVVGTRHRDGVVGARLRLMTRDELRKKCDEESDEDEQFTSMFRRQGILRVGSRTTGGVLPAGFPSKKAAKKASDEGGLLKDEGAGSGSHHWHSEGGHRRRSSMVFSSTDELDSNGTHSICDGFAADSDRPPQRHASFFSADLEGGIEMETMEHVAEEEDMSGTDEEVMPELPDEDEEDYGSGMGVVPQLRNNPVGSRRSVFASV